MLAAERPDWSEVGSKAFFVLAWFPIVMMIPAALGVNDDEILQLAAGLPFYGWTAVGLASVAGLFRELHKIKFTKRTGKLRN